MLNPWKDRKKQAGPDTEDEEIDPATGASEAGTTDGPDAGGEGTLDTRSPAGEEAAPAGAADVAEPETEVADHDRRSIEAELAELKDRHLRLAAEFENFRKRTRKEASVGRTLAQADLVGAILPTLDDLARVSETPHESTTVEALDEGIELILKNFRKQLESAGLERVEALDERFDPERHQAVMTTGTEDPALDETVSRVLLDGYVFLGRLVRPAQVEVRRYEEPGDETDDE